MRLTKEERKTVNKFLSLCYDEIKERSGAFSNSEYAVEFVKMVFKYQKRLVNGK